MADGQHEEDCSWSCHRCTYVNKSKDPKCIMCHDFIVLLHDEDNSEGTPKCDIDWNNPIYDGDYESDDQEEDQDEPQRKEKDAKSEKEDVEEMKPEEMKPEEKKVQEVKAEDEKKEDEELDAGDVAGPSRWKKKQNRKKELRNAKKAKTETNEVNTTLADSLNLHCTTSSDESE